MERSEKKKHAHGQFWCKSNSSWQNLCPNCLSIFLFVRVQAGKVVRSAVVNDELSQNYKEQMPVAGVRFKPLKGKRGIGKEIFFSPCSFKAWN